MRLLLIAVPFLLIGPTVSPQHEVLNLVNRAILVDRLEKTKLLNGTEIYDRLQLINTRTCAGRTPSVNPSVEFYTANPYKPRYQESFNRLDDLASRLPQNALSYRSNKLTHRFTFLGQEPVFEWYSSISMNADVCAVRFKDNVKWVINTLTPQVISTPALRAINIPLELAFSTPLVALAEHQA